MGRGATFIKKENFIKLYINKVKTIIFAYKFYVTLVLKLSSSSQVFHHFLYIISFRMNKLLLHYFKNNIRLKLKNKIYV